MTTPHDTTRNYFQAPKASKPKKRTIRRMSANKARDMKEYTRLRAQFMAERPVCEVWLQENGWTQVEFSDPFYSRDGLLTPAEHLLAIGAHRSSECHHVFGRRKNYLNVSTWLAVSAQAHRRIHASPSWARANGFLK